MSIQSARTKIRARAWPSPHPVSLSLSLSLSLVLVAIVPIFLYVTRSNYSRCSQALSAHSPPPPIPASSSSSRSNAAAYIGLTRYVGPQAGFSVQPLRTDGNLVVHPVASAPIAVRRPIGAQVSLQTERENSEYFDKGNNELGTENCRRKGEAERRTSDVLGQEHRQIPEGPLKNPEKVSPPSHNRQWKADSKGKENTSDNNSIYPARQ